LKSLTWQESFPPLPISPAQSSVACREFGGYFDFSLHSCCEITGIAVCISEHCRVPVEFSVPHPDTIAQLFSKFDPEGAQIYKLYRINYRQSFTLLWKANWADKPVEGDFHA